MSTQVQLFQFEGVSMQTVTIDGKEWWVAKDICACLGIENTRQAIENLAEDEKLMYVSDTSGQRRQILLVNEPGLYRLIFRSNKPKAEEFRRWVFHEVLPSIRKTGSYTMNLHGKPIEHVRVQQIVKAPEECMGCHKVVMGGYRKTAYYKGFLCKECGYVLFRHVNSDYKTGDTVHEPSQSDYDVWVEARKGLEPNLKHLKPWLRDAVLKQYVILNSDNEYIVATVDATIAVSAVQVERR